MITILQQSGIDVKAVKAQWDAMNEEYRARLPEKDVNGKKVDKSKHHVNVEKLDTLINRAVTLEAVDQLVGQLKLELKEAIVGAAKSVVDGEGSGS